MPILMTRARRWDRYLADERLVVKLPGRQQHSLALGYANTYHVGMSSLALQRVYRLIHKRPGWSCERFFTDSGDGVGMPRSVERATPLDTFGCVAFSVSFEEDYVNLLQMLNRSGIPLRRRDRRAQDPLVMMAGSCAMINPLPMSEFVDVFPLGAAENLLPAMLAALEEEERREGVLERLASTAGFYVPAYHHPQSDPELPKLDKLELSAAQMAQPGYLPVSCIVTPHTEFADKLLIEMSRGCPEKCRYCWATFGMGTFRCHPTEFILQALERGRSAADQVGFVATAVGDHPDLDAILVQAGEMGYRTSLSSIRIPAVSETLLASVHASGGRSITLAPETGTDRLRALMGKPVTNRLFLEKVGMIFAHGFTQLKLYFIIGLPDETLDDVRGIVDLAAEVRQVMLREASKQGVVAQVHLGTNILIPKPYTPWQRVPLDDPRNLETKTALLRRGVAKLPNVSLGSMSIRRAMWQAYITKAGADAADALEGAAGGTSLSVLLRDFAHRIEPEIYRHLEGDLRWHFMRTATAKAPPPAAAPQPTTG
jgi:radical SAM superfamily enzyme YgiQ (UPF0313 family)